MTLEAMAEELAGRRNDPRTPAVVRRAFLAPGLTLRNYLALEEADSPVLSGRWPTEDAEAMAGAFCRAWELVFPGECMPSAEGFPEGLARLQEAVTGAFATVMPMRFAGQREESPTPPDGLGWVARVVGRFVGIGWRLEEVLDVPLGALFVLLAGMAANEGAECAGQDYREREGGMKDEVGRMKDEGECSGSKGRSNFTQDSPAGAGSSFSPRVAEAHGVEPAEEPQDEGGEDQGGCKNDG